MRRYLFIFILLLISFAGTVMAEEKASEEKAFTTCTEPRPQMCTQDYRPVCAKLNDDSMKTYSNGCMACSDPKVVGYYQGACEE
ncbi:Kazal-type serine protease inhibitor family protein [Kaarinaea lacus]